MKTVMIATVGMLAGIVFSLIVCFCKDQYAILTSDDKITSLFAYTTARNRKISTQTHNGFEKKKEWLEHIRNSSFLEKGNYPRGPRTETHIPTSDNRGANQIMFRNALLPTIDTHSVKSETAVSALFHQMANECECRSPPSCSKCGIVNCWDGIANSTSESCQFLFNTASAVPIRNGSSNEIVEAKKFDAVLDFDCDHLFPRAAFHVLVDCFNVQLSMVAMVLYSNTDNSSKEHKIFKHVAIVSPGNMLRYMELLCVALKTHGIKPTFISSIGPRSDQSNKCLAQHFSSKSIAFSSGYPSWFVVRSSNLNASEKSMACLTGGSLFAALVRQNYHKKNTKCQKIIIMSREGTRRFMDQKDLLAALNANFGRGNILVHHGNESFAESVGMFRQACAVVGFHGAGAINMFFTPPGTLCLEVVIFDTSTTGSSSKWRPWRSNEQKISRASGSRWQLKLIEPHHYWVPRGNAANIIMKNGDVQLTREHISDIIWRLESHLEHADHGLVQRKSALAPITVPFRIPDVRLGFR
jgi:hypothetical protein